MNKEEVIAKVRKLVAMQQSSNANEAETANRLMKKFIEEYNIDSSQLENIKAKNLEIAETYVSTGQLKPNRWMSYLASSIAHLYDCTALVKKYDYKFVFVGYEVDRIACEAMFTRLQTLIRKEAFESTSRIKIVGRQHFINDFSVGAAAAIADRLKKLKEDVQKNEHALMVLKSEEIIDFLKEKFPDIKEGRSSNPTANSAFFRRGQQYGESIVVNEQLGGSE